MLLPLEDLSSSGNSSWNCTSTVDHRNGTLCPSDYPCIHGSCRLHTLNTSLETGAVRFTCQCDVGWTGAHCDVCCDLDCNSGVCHIQNGRRVCRCEWGLSGDYCNESIAFFPDMGPLEFVRGNELPRSLVVTLVCVSVVLAVGASLAFTLFLWYKRRPILMKMINKFISPSLPDSESYRYDAFVSFRSGGADQYFAMDHMLPNLEDKMGFKLCVHFRDFGPGAPIAENILEAVEKSRHTILLLSPDFVASEWTRFEYQVAQHAMLQQRHRIIPVILRHFKMLPVIDRNLKHILETITYIEWPGVTDSEKERMFWEKLKSALSR